MIILHNCGSATGNSKFNEGAYFNGLRRFFSRKDSNVKSFISTDFSWPLSSQLTGGYMDELTFAM